MGTGYAYVTFQNKNSAQDAIKCFNSRAWKESFLTKESLNLSKNWKIQKSHKASDIIMENLIYSSCNQWTRFFIGNIFLFLVFMVAGGIGFTFGFHSIERSLLKETLFERFQYFQEFFDGVNFLFDLQPLWILFITTVSLPMLKLFIDFSKYKTVTEATKASIFLFLFYLVIYDSLIV
jgi:RNA recognition motif-containing protein